MNRNGQTLLCFVIIIPIFLILSAFVIDTGLTLKEKTRINSTTKTIIKTTYNKRLESNYYELVTNLYKENKINIANLEVISNDNNISIEIESKIDAIFGKIIGLNEYKILIKLKGINENEKIKIIKE